MANEAGLQRRAVEPVISVKLKPVATRRKRLDLKQKLEWFSSRDKSLVQEQANNGGRLRRGDFWRRDYYKNPYLARATDAQFFKRVCDVFHNQMELDEEGRITPKPSMNNNNWLMQRWAHVMEEAGTRGGFNGELLSSANEPLRKYFENGRAPGVELFRDFKNAPKAPLVKYSRREFVESMYRFGEIRVAPASEYASGSLLDAQRDLEVQREFIIPTAKLIAKGYTQADIEGQQYNIAEGDVSIVEETENYYVFCLCREVDRRLPSDFNADAALVIHDATAFQRLFFDALRERLGNWEMRNGHVTYYDPYSDYKRHRVLEMTKHFKFHYQKEFRLLARPKRQLQYQLEPFFLRLGSLENLATPYYMPG